MKVLTRTSKMSIIRRMKYYKLLVFVGIRFTSFTYNFTVMFDLSVITFIFTEELLCFRYISQWSRPRKKKTW